jgi:hypothetical protein
MNQTTRRAAGGMIQSSGGRGGDATRTPQRNLTRTHSVSLSYLISIYLGQTPSLHTQDSTATVLRGARSAICRVSAPQLVRPPNSHFDPPFKNY